MWFKFTLNSIFFWQNLVLTGFYLVFHSFSVYVKSDEVEICAVYTGSVQPYSGASESTWQRPESCHANTLNKCVLPFIVKTNKINLKPSMQPWFVERRTCTQPKAHLSSSVCGLIIYALCVKVFMQAQLWCDLNAEVSFNISEVKPRGNDYLSFALCVRVYPQ